VFGYHKDSATLTASRLNLISQEFQDFFSVMIGWVNSEDAPISEVLHVDGQEAFSIREDQILVGCMPAKDCSNAVVLIVAQVMSRQDDEECVG
jgi:hypothetical protein